MAVPWCLHCDDKGESATVHAAHERHAYDDLRCEAISAHEK